VHVVTDLTEQKRNEELRIEEEVLQKAHDELEQHVDKRTEELQTVFLKLK